MNTKVSTYSIFDEVLDWSGDWKFSPDKDRVGFTSNIGECVCTQISSRANHVIESHEKCSPLPISPCLDTSEWTYSKREQ
jgi:hypothetical protein